MEEDLFLVKSELEWLLGGQMWSKQLKLSSRHLPKVAKGGGKSDNVYLLLKEYDESQDVHSM